MELTEPVLEINKRLKDLFGVDSLTGLSMWRVSWSEDQFENRYGTYDDITPAGIYLRTVTEVRYVPKYRQWIQEKYVLEHLVLVPEVNQKELPDIKLSYEPLWVFQDKDQFPLPPKWEAIELIINTVHAAMNGTKDLAKYVDPEDSLESSIDLKKKRIEDITNELYGDDSGLNGTTITASGESIIVPNSYQKVNN